MCVCLRESDEVDVNVCVNERYTSRGQRCECIKTQNKWRTINPDDSPLPVPSSCPYCFALLWGKFNLSPLGLCQNHCPSQQQRHYSSLNWAFPLLLPVSAFWHTQFHTSVAPHTNGSPVENTSRCHCPPPLLSQWRHFLLSCKKPQTLCTTASCLALPLQTRTVTPGCKHSSYNTMLIQNI